MLIDQPLVREIIGLIEVAAIAVISRPQTLPHANLPSPSPNTQANNLGKLAPPDLFPHRLLACYSVHMMSKYFIKISSISALTFGAAALFLSLYLADLSNHLPRRALTNQAFSRDTLPLASEVFDRTGVKIGEFVSEKRYFIAFHELPAHLVQAVLSAEDKSFFSHSGLSLPAIFRAAITNLKFGMIKEGASTITQQLAKVYFLSREKSLARKLKEIYIALAIEKQFTKKEIFELYINKIFFGNHAFGIEAASRAYLGKSAKFLSIAESALLAGLPKAPSYYAIHRHFKRARKRQRLILRRMLKNEHISRTQYKNALIEKIHYLKQKPNTKKYAQYFVDEVRKFVEKRFEAKGILNTSGLKIHTTLDISRQKIMERRLGAAVEQLNTKRNSSMLPKKSERDLLLPRRQHQDSLQASAITIDPSNGAILALQGGVDYQKSQYNRAFMTKREIGSVFIPIFAAKSIDAGYTLATPVDIEPKDIRSIRSGSSTSQFPSVYEVLTRNDTENAVVLFAALGVRTISRFAHRLGFRFKDFDLRMSLGRGRATLLQITQAYSVFSNKGKKVTPYLVEEIRDSAQKILYQKHHIETPQLIRRETAFIMTKALQDSGKHGYAKDFASTFRSPPPEMIHDTPLAITAGTSRDNKNGWIIGSRDRQLTTIWVGSEFGSISLGDSKKNTLSELERIWSASAGRIQSHDQHIEAIISPLQKISYYRVKIKQSDGTATSRTLPFAPGTYPQ